MLTTIADGQGVRGFRISTALRRALDCHEPQVWTHKIRGVDIAQLPAA